jgi:hypothetical protein
MHIWIIILFATAGVVFGLDYLFRRKKWKDNSKAEKISLLVNMFSVTPYIYLSALGMLWGIVTYAPETSLGEIIYDVTLRMASIYFIIAVVAVILSFVLRIKDKNKASVGTNIIALLYIVVILALNLFAGKLL